MGEAIRSATGEELEDTPAETGVAKRRRSAYCAAVAATSDFRSRLVRSTQWTDETGTSPGTATA